MGDRKALEASQLENSMLDTTDNTPKKKQTAKKRQKPSEDVKKKAAEAVKKMKAAKSLNKNSAMWSKVFQKIPKEKAPQDEKTEEQIQITKEGVPEVSKSTPIVEVVDLEPAPTPKGVIVMKPKRTHNTPAASSPVWDVFVRIKGDDKRKDEAFCRECGEVRKCKGGNTSGMLKHIRKDHPTLAKQTPLKLQTQRGKRDNDWQKEMSVEYALSLAVDLRPLSSGEAEGARTFFSKLCPDFKVPSHHTVRNHLTAIKMLIDKKVCCVW
jgi:hypothetical protein